MEVVESIGVGPLAVDTAIFIYFVEQHARYADLVRPIFHAADRGELALVTSAVTLLELLVVPYRVGDLSLAARYETLLTQSAGLRMVALDHAQLRTAAHIRARFGVRTPDALQLAAAVTAHCTAFLTNDRRLPQIPGLRIVQLDAVQ